MAEKIKIVTVDDSPNVLEVVVSILEAEGYAVTTCSDIDQAFPLIKSVQPSLLLLDAMMPSKEGNDGFSLCNRIKEDPETSHIPVVFLSGIAAGSGKSEEELKATSGAQDFIQKPFDPKDFVERIKKQLKEV